MPSMVRCFRLSFSFLATWAAAIRYLDLILEDRQNVGKNKIIISVFVANQKAEMHCSILFVCYDMRIEDVWSMNVITSPVLFSPGPLLSNWCYLWLRRPVYCTVQTCVRWVEEELPEQEATKSGMSPASALRRLQLPLNDVNTCTTLQSYILTDFPINTKNDCLLARSADRDYQNNKYVFISVLFS